VHFKLLFCKKKNDVFTDFRKFLVRKKKGVRKSQICKSLKNLGPQIAKPQIATFAEGPLQQKIRRAQTCGFAIAESICGPPTFKIITG
jgi:hypothetical protein